MKVLLLAYFFSGTLNYTDDPIVYICNNNNPKKYHYKADCRGLSNCQARIVKMTLKSAASSGKTLCEWERNATKTTKPQQ